MVLFVILFSFEEVHQATERGTEHTETQKLPGEHILWRSGLESHWLLISFSTLNN